MVTGVPEKITYCSPRTSLGKQKKNCLASQPQFRSRNTPATIEADQTLLALHQLANSNNSRISKATFTESPNCQNYQPSNAHVWREIREVELLEDLFQTNLKIHNQLIEDDRFNYFHSLTRGVALQRFRNINNRTRENLAETLAVFHRKYVNLSQCQQRSINSRNWSSSRRIKS